MRRLPLFYSGLFALGAIALTACSGQATTTVQPAAEVQVTPTTMLAAPSATDAPTEAPLAVPPMEAPTEAPAASGAVSFAQDVLPILQDSCIQCHGTSRQRAGLALNTYEAVLAGADGGAVILPDDAASSKLVQMITSGEMPKDNPRLSDPAIQLIRDWIDQGALDN